MKTVYSRAEFLKEASKCIPKNGAAVELGVFNGDFSEMILDYLKSNRLHLIDPFEINEETYGDAMRLTTAYSTDKQYADVFDKFSHEILTGKVVVNRKYSYDAVKDYPNNYFNFIYIDASHLYKDVKQDLNDWLPKLKNGGLMCGHDYVNHDSFGVIKAVDEFCSGHDFEMVLLNLDGGDWALKSKK